MPSAVPLRPVRMEDDLYQKLVYISRFEERSFNQQIVYISRRFVEQWEKDHDPIDLDQDSD